VGVGAGAADLVERLCRARIGETFNFYRDGPRAGLLAGRLRDYLERQAGAATLLVAEAPGYRGTRVSGLPLTSERQLSGTGPAEATASIVHAALSELELENDVLLWNVVPTHPGSASANRRPSRREIEAGLPFARELARGRRVVAVGRIAEQAFGGAYLRHPAHGGAAAFRCGLALQLAAQGRRSPGAPHGMKQPATIRQSAERPAPFQLDPTHEDLQRQDGRSPA
jgi:hypothetical protein